MHVLSYILVLKVYRKLLMTSIIVVNLAFEYIPKVCYR